jgi:hypothetical protein
MLNLEPYTPVIGPVVEVVVTLFLKWKESGKRDAHSSFHEIFEPAFNELLIIHKDYIDMFQKTSQLLFDSEMADERKFLESLRDAAAFLERRRTELEPERMELRALAKELAYDPSRESAFVRAVATYLSAWPPDSVGTASVGLLARIEAIAKQPSVTPSELAAMLVQLDVHINQLTQRQRDCWAQVCETFAPLKVRAGKSG